MSIFGRLLSGGGGGDRRRRAPTPGHLRRWWAGQVPLLNLAPRLDRALAALRSRDGDTVDPRALAQVLTRHRDAFRPEPSRALLPRAGAPTLRVGAPGGGVTEARLAYDAGGRLEVRSRGIDHGPSPYELSPAGTRTVLTTENIAEVRALREALERGNIYNSLGQALFAARVVRRTRATQSRPFSFKDAVPHLEMEGAAFCAAFGGGSCFALAQVLRKTIQQRFGINAHVASEQIVAGSLCERPQLTRRGRAPDPVVLAAVDGVTHTNVIVPFVDEAGKERFLRISVGVGPEAEVRRQGKPDPIVNTSRAERAACVAADPNLPRERLVGHPERLVAQTIGGPVRLHMHRWDTGVTVGLDLVASTLYISGKAHAGLRGGTGALDLSDPAALDGLATMLDVVQAQFGLHDEARADLDFLCRHLDAYCDEIPVGCVGTLRRCAQERDAAVEARDATAALLRPLHLWPGAEAYGAEVDRGEAALLRAATCVERGRGQEAAAAYREAKGAFAAAAALVEVPSAPLADPQLAACEQAVARLPQGRTSEHLRMALFGARRLATRTSKTSG